MDFDLTEEQKSIQRAAREFAQDNFTPELARECDQKEEFPFELQKKAAKLGFIGIFLPEEYGGQGLGFIEYCLVVEEYCRADSTLGSALILQLVSAFHHTALKSRRISISRCWQRV